MVEYGNGVAHGTGAAGGGGGGGGGDAGVAFGQWVGDTVHNIAALPPSTLAIAVVVIVVGLMVLRRAF
jgi:hypothetical protein